VQRKVKIPFTVAISFIFPLASLMVASGALAATGIEWLSRVFAFGTCEASASVPLYLSPSIAGLIASLVVMNIQRNKLRHLMWISAAFALAFSLLALGLALWKRVPTVLCSVTRK